jgi:glycosyltransferase involved in cell wall biosynthesis
MNILAYVHLRGIHGSTGAGRVSRQMVEQLARNPEDRVVILADPKDHARVIPQVGAPWAGFDYRFFRHETSLQQARWLFLNQPAAETFWPEAQIVYCTGESYVPASRAKLVVTLHDAAIFENDAHAPSWALRKQRLKWNYLYWMLSRKADLFHTVSQFSADRIGHFFPRIKSRLRVVPNGVPARFFSTVSDEGEAARKALGLADRRFVLLPRGLDFRKNSDLVLQVWPRLVQRHPELLLVITSHCKPHYARQALALGASVRLTGFVSDEALCSIYHAAEVVWFPSRYEGFGMPVLEAMACGTPVVASNTSSLPEVAGDAALLVSPFSVDANVAALDSILNDSKLKESLSLRGSLRAKQFTWEAAAAQLRAHFNSLI